METINNKGEREYIGIFTTLIQEWANIVKECHFGAAACIA